MYEIETLQTSLKEIETKEINKDKDCLSGYCELTEKDFYHELYECDFYPPEDTRLYTSGIDDVYGGDSFAEYAEYFWEMYEDELFD